MGQPNFLYSKIGWILILCLLMSACTVDRIPAPSDPTTTPTLASPAGPEATETSQPEPAATSAPVPTHTSPVATESALEPVPTLQASSPTPEPSPMAAATLTAAPTAARMTPSPPVPTASLTLLGPWMAYFDPEFNVLAAANPAGLGKTVLLQSSSILAIAGSSMNYLAVVVRWPAFADSYPSNEALIVYDLPSGQIRSMIPLVIYPSLSGRWDFSASLAWSPDGRYLAYVAALHDDSLDLYVYDAAARLSFRLTSRSNPAASPFWSPDGKWIIHTEQANDTVVCRGIALWAAAVDGSGVKELVRENCPTALVGWYAPDRFIIADQQNNTAQDLWAVNLSSGSAIDLLPDGFQISTGSTPSLNPNSGDVAFDGCFESGLCGTFAASAANPTPQRLTGSLAQMAWMPAMDQFIGSPGADCHLFVFSPGVAPRCILEDLNPVDIYTGFSLSPDGIRLFSPSFDGYYLSSAALGLVQISAGGQPLEDCHLISWSPDGRAFLLRCDAGLFVGQTTTAQANLVSGSVDMHPDRMLWRFDSGGIYIVAEERLFYLDSARFDLLPLGAASVGVGMHWVGR